MISYELGYRNGINTHEFKWKSSSISQKEYNSFFNCNVGNSDNNYTYECTDAIECSIKAQAIHCRILKTNGNIQIKLKNILRDYPTVSIVDISKKYRVPPINTMRAILNHLDYSRQMVHDIIQGKELCTNDWDRQQMKLAWSIDITNATNARITSETAQLAEDRLFNLLKKYCPCKSQNDLSAEQIAIHGRPISTPDILFLEPTYINDREVHWVDYKNYVLGPIHLQKNRAQVDKYNVTWGPGVLCTSLVYVADIDLHTFIITCI